MKLSFLLVVFILLLTSSSYARTLEEIKKTNTIVIGCKIDPSKVIDSLNDRNINFAIGFDIDLIFLIQKYFQSIGIQTTFKDGVKAKNRKPWLKNNTVDIIISSYSITQDRMDDTIAFSTPYLENPGLQ